MLQHLQNVVAWRDGGEDRVPAVQEVDIQEPEQSCEIQLSSGLEAQWEEKMYQWTFPWSQRVTLSKTAQQLQVADVQDIWTCMSTCRQMCSNQTIQEP